MKRFDIPTRLHAHGAGRHELHLEIHTGNAEALNFYRIEFKRSDGAGLREHWREWYPFMPEMH